LTADEKDIVELAQIHFRMLRRRVPFDDGEFDFSLVSKDEKATAVVRDGAIRFILVEYKNLGLRKKIKLDAPSSD
jgi:hypothetical protein